MPSKKTFLLLLIQILVGSALYFIDRGEAAGIGGYPTKVSLTFWMSSIFFWGNLYATIVLWKKAELLIQKIGWVALLVALSFLNTIAPILLVISIGFQIFAHNPGIKKRVTVASALLTYLALCAYSFAVVLIKNQVFPATYP